MSSHSIARIRRISSGMCGICGKTPFDVGYKACGDCRVKSSNNALKRMNRLKNNGLCILCGHDVPDGKAGRCVSCTKRTYAYARNLRSKYRTIVYRHYGDRCSCCGEAQTKFLNIDHSNNNGKAHRKMYGRCINYKWIVDQQFPKDLRLLCFNCNCGRERNGGVCPHKG